MINSATREDPPMRPYPLILAGLLTGCASLSHDTRLDDALSEQFGSELPGYQSALYDLDDDGVDDALIYAQGPDWCVAPAAPCLCCKAASTLSPCAPEPPSLSFPCGCPRTALMAGAT